MSLSHSGDSALGLALPGALAAGGVLASGLAYLNGAFPFFPGTLARGDAPLAAVCGAQFLDRDVPSLAGGGDGMAKTSGAA